MITGQLDLFDLLDATKPTVIPLDSLRPVIDAGTFTNPGDFEAMYNQKRAWHTEYHVDKGNWRPYRGWAAKQYTGKDSAHLAESFDADLRCFHYSGGCSCAGTLVYRVFCHNCEHWTGIYDSENLAWEEHLDHCWPGWRELPVLESRQVGYGYKWELPADYPERFRQIGAPIRDCRRNGGRRHVPGANQFGGVTVGVEQDCPKH